MAPLGARSSGRGPTADPDVPASLHDRAADCWRPLIAIAHLAGGDWPELARAAAMDLSSAEHEDAEPVVELLRHIAEYLADCDTEIIRRQDLLAALVARPDRRWATWRHDRPMTERGLARLLGPLGIHPAQHRAPVGVRRGYRRDAWADAMSRYVPTHAGQRDGLNDDGPLSHMRIRDSDPGLSHMRMCDRRRRYRAESRCHT